MKYVALDLETSKSISADDEPSSNDILMLSMVVDDTEKPEIQVHDLPHFTCLLDQHPIVGNRIALSMNSWILLAVEASKAGLDTYPKKQKFINKLKDLQIPDDTIHRAMFAYDYYPIYDVCRMDEEATKFLKNHFKNEKATLAGKNVGIFDFQFLTPSLQNSFRHGILDVGVLYWDCFLDNSIPSSSKVWERAGLHNNKLVAHNALSDNFLTIQAVREFIKKKGKIQ